jgi:hypothetical protein
MEGRTNYTWMALSQGWPGPSLSVLSLCACYLPVKAEARYLIYCDAPSLYRLTWMFGHIPLVRSLVLFRESMKEVGDHTLKISSRRYDGFLNLLEHPYLML